MRFEQIIPQQTPEILDEVKMTASVYDEFLNSDLANGVKCGFEAEMCFIGLGGGDEDFESEPDYGYDERANDIDDICNFFDDGGYNSRRDIQSLREQLQESFWEWQSEKLYEAWSNVEYETVKEYIEENDYDRDEEIMNYLTDHLELDSEQAQAVIDSSDDKQSNPEAYALYSEAADHASEVLDEKVTDSIDSHDRNYERAQEAWEEGQRGEFEESDWLRNEGIRYMSDVERAYDITWPYYTDNNSESGFNEDNANKLADDLSNTLNVEVYASSGYHSAERTATLWIIEPDSSLEADNGDMPAEIISPPMPIKECLNKITEFFMWADSNEAYTNSSTGFHVGVSLPHVEGRVDYVKLALFLGDKHVLDQFDRVGNTYCKSAMDKIRTNAQTENISQTFEIMRKGLVELAAKTLRQANGHGKYTSINMKGDYIEFRSMGDQYHTKVPEIIDTVKRYAYAMFIASRPDLYRRQYAKKLYKMLAKSGNNDSVALFSQLASGEISKEALKQHLQSRHVNRTASKNGISIPTWQIFNRSNNTVSDEFQAPSKEAAAQKFDAFMDINDLNPLNFTLRQLQSPQ